jgi:DNA-binding XRE family transcriptional regulator
MTQDQLAEEIGVSRATLIRAEEGAISTATERALIKYFESEGITLYEKGFEIKDKAMQTLSGSDGLQEMYKQMYRAIRTGHADLWLYNGVSQKVADALGAEFISYHQSVMQELEGRFNWRVVVEDGDDAFWGHKYAYYKWIPKEYFNDLTIYVFGNKTAFVDFADGVSITIINNKHLTDTQRLFLDNTWNDTAYDPHTEKPFRPE